MSGIRIGTPASTTRGFGVAEMTDVANWIADVLDSQGAPEIVAKTQAKVVALCRRFPVYGA